MMLPTTPTQRARKTQCKATMAAFASSVFPASVCLVGAPDSFPSSLKGC